MKFLVLRRNPVTRASMPATQAELTIPEDQPIPSEVTVGGMSATVNQTTYTTATSTLFIREAEVRVDNKVYLLRVMTDGGFSTSAQLVSNQLAQAGLSWDDFPHYTIED